MNQLPYIIDDRETPKFWVNRATMVEQKILDLEKKKIFDKCWLYVGHESELNNVNDFRTRRVGGRPIIFTRSATDKINVLVNVCTHRGMILETRKEGNARNMRCFYHGWQFNTEGRLTSMPAEEDYPAGWKRAERCLPRPAHAAGYRGFWFLCWDKEQTQSLEEYLGNATDYIDLLADQACGDMMQVSSGTQYYTMHANWKLLVENSIDGYHAATTHNRFLQMVSASVKESDFDARKGSKARVGVRRKRTSLKGNGTADLGNGHVSIGGSDLSKGKSRGGLGRAFTNSDLQQEHMLRRDEYVKLYGEEWTDRMLGGRNMLIFPNLVINDLGMGATIRAFYPEEPGYMDVTSWEISPPDLSAGLHEARKSDFLTFWGPAGLATPDDVEALARCQRGFESYAIDPWNDISRGMDKSEDELVGAGEVQMRVFWRHWNTMMTGAVSELEAEIEPYEKVEKSDLIVRSRS